MGRSHSLHQEFTPATNMFVPTEQHAVRQPPATLPDVYAWDLVPSGS